MSENPDEIKKRLEELEIEIEKKEIELNKAFSSKEEDEENRVVDNSKAIRKGLLQEREAIRKG